MIARSTALCLLALAMMCCLAEAGSAQPVAVIALPEPDRSGGMPLMQALQQRQSRRAFSPQALSPEQLSNLLWAAFGQNRLDGGRTAPSALNWQEIDIYEGVYRYDAAAHQLNLALAQDIRSACGKQDFVATAPVVLVYVADLNKARTDDSAAQQRYIAVDTGFISQNVYLYCASEYLSTVVLGWVDTDALAQALQLGENQQIMFTQPVGRPAE